MESKEQRKKKLKLLNEMSRAYTKLDRLVIENKMLKNTIRKAIKDIQKRDGVGLDDVVNRLKSAL